MSEHTVGVCQCNDPRVIPDGEKCPYCISCNAACAGAADPLPGELKRLREELELPLAVARLQRNAMKPAEDLWRKETGADDLTYPGLPGLLEWLVKRGDEAREQLRLATISEATAEAEAAEMLGLLEDIKSDASMVPATVHPESDEVYIISADLMRCVRRALLGRESTKGEGDAEKKHG